MERALVDPILPNVHLGTSIENARWTHRAEILAQVPSAARFISAEPLIGTLYEQPTFQGIPEAAFEDSRWWCENGHISKRYLKSEETGRDLCLACGEPVRLAGKHLNLDGIDWVIVGAESGGGRRLYDMAWAREIRDACVTSGTAFFYKQSDAFRSGHHPYLIEEDGSCWEWHQYPGDLAKPVRTHLGMSCEESHVEWAKCHPTVQEALPL